STQPPWAFKELVAHVSEIAQETKVFNTVCPVTVKRQHAASELAEQVNTIIVVGGKNSANTRELVNLAKMQGRNAYHIEGADELRAEWRGRRLRLIGTGGLDDEKGQGESAVRKQAQAAIDEADVVVFVVDAQTGILPVEHDVADRLRRSRKPVLLAANKTESWRAEAQAAEVYEPRLGDRFPVSPR